MAKTGVAGTDGGASKMPGSALAKASAEPFVRTTWAEEIGVPLDTLQSIAVDEVADAGQVRSVSVSTESTQRTLEVSRFVRLLRRDGRRALRSTRFTIEEEDGSFVIRGRGWGHRVGLCQVGAGRRGAHQSYRQILTAYYPESDIAQLANYYP